MQVNDLAILLTQEIMKDLISSHYMGQSVKFHGETSECHTVTNTPPSFYAVRERILKTLSKYIDVLDIDVKYSPITLDQMRPEMKKQYISDNIKKEACYIVERIVNSDDHFDKLTFEDTKYMFSQRKYIAVLKTGLINKDSLREKEL